MPYNATLCKEALGKVFVAPSKLFHIWQVRSGAYKNFYAVGSGGNRRTKTLYRAEKSSFSFLVL